MTSTIRAAFVSLLILVPAGAASADSVPIAPQAPLTLPTPSAPMLRRPDVEPLPPSLMLKGMRPLQMPQSAPRPSLNSFPGVGADASGDADDEVPDDEGEPRLYLQHR